MDRLILDETFHSLARNRPDLDRRLLDRTRRLMCEAIRDGLVTGYEPLIEVLKLPDPDDRHVLAAAIKAHAQVIVTSNALARAAPKIRVARTGHCGMRWNRAAWATATAGADRIRRPVSVAYGEKGAGNVA